MSNHVTLAYQLGCQCAAEVFEKQAAGGSDALRAAARLVDTGGASAAKQTARATARKGARRGAAAVTEEAAAPAAAAPGAAPEAAPGLWDQFLGSRGAQYAAGGLGGAGLGALTAGEDNRLRGAMMGAGAGLGAVGGARFLGGGGKATALQKLQMNRSPAEFEAIQKQLGPDGLAQLAKREGQIETGIGAGVGGLGGLIAGRGLAPGHQAPEKPWLERARGLLPF